MNSRRGLWSPIGLTAVFLADFLAFPLHLNNSIEKVNKRERDTSFLSVTATQNHCVFVWFTMPRLWWLNLSERHADVEMRMASPERQDVCLQKVLLLLCYYTMSPDQRNSNRRQSVSFARHKMQRRVQGSLCLSTPTRTVTEVTGFSSTETFTEWYIFISEVIWNSLWKFLSRHTSWIQLQTNAFCSADVLRPCSTGKDIWYNSQQRTIKWKSGSFHRLGFSLYCHWR